jgi:hypothetical protein
MSGGGVSLGKKGHGSEAQPGEEMLEAQPRRADGAENQIGWI